MPIEEGTESSPSLRKHAEKENQASNQEAEFPENPFRRLRTSLWLGNRVEPILLFLFCYSGEPILRELVVVVEWTQPQQVPCRAAAASRPAPPPAAPPTLPASAAPALPRESAPSAASLPKPCQVPWARKNSASSILRFVVESTTDQQTGDKLWAGSRARRY